MNFPVFASFLQFFSGFRLKNVIANIPFLISFFSFVALNAVNGEKRFLFVVIALFGFALSFFVVFDLKKMVEKKYWCEFLLSAFFVWWTAREFGMIMAEQNKYMIKFYQITGYPELPVAGSLTVFFFVLAIPFSTWFLVNVFEIMQSLMQKYRKSDIASEKTDWQGKLAVFLYSLVTAVVILSIGTKSSPLYPFNDYCDPHCFFTVGKSMLHGLVPYRDLLEQKGPLLYFLHALAALVSYRTFLGVFFLQIIAAAFFLYYSYQTLQLFGRRISVLWLPVIAGLTYSALAFRDGDTAEELCLSFLMYGMYVGFKALRQRKLPIASEFVLVGITAACVFWIKYTMMGFYLGWFITFAFLAVREKQIVGLLKGVALILLGGVILTIPILVYFIANSACYDLWYAYFYGNLFLYSSVSPDSVMIRLMQRASHSLFEYHWWAGITFLLALAFVVCRKYVYEILFLCSLFFCLYFSVFIGGMFWVYYPFVFSVFIPLGVMAAAYMIPGNIIPEKVFFRLTPVLFVLLLTACTVYVYFTSANTYALFGRKDDLPHIKFAKIINEKENATLLCYGCLDMGMYTSAGIVPNCKAFNILNSPFPEQTQLQDEMVQNGAVDFITTRKEFNFEHYTCIARGTYIDFWQTERTCYLYRKIESPEN